MFLIFKRKFLFFAFTLLVLNSEAKRVIIFMKESARKEVVTFGLTQNLISKNQVEQRNQADKLVQSLGNQIKVSQIKKTLSRLNSLIVDQLEDTEILELRKNKNVLLIDTEVIRPLPFLVRNFKKIALPLSQKISSFFSMTPWGILAVKALEAWNESMGGAGARVLILDTGIDRDHPSLRPNLELGKDFVGDDQDGYPYKDTIGHGTHVAGTIAGVLDSTGFSGVAPKARILAGRVCAPEGCSNLAVAEGIEWGMQQKVDVISMSLGGAWASPAERLAVSKASKEGVTIVAASGNDGSNSISYPAALPDVIAVGAIDSQFKKASFSQYGPELAVVAPGVDVVSSVPMGHGRAPVVSFTVGEGSVQTVRSVTFEGGKSVLTPESYEMVFAGLGKEEDFSKINAEGKVALIQRGEIKFIDKVKNAIQAKASGVIFYNNTEGLIQGAITSDGSQLPVGVFMVEQKVGESLKESLEKGMVVNSTYEILVTNQDSFNGTSMATPHVSGVVALMKAANKNLTPSQVKRILQKTATPLGPNENNEMGAGLVNAEKAVHEATLSQD